VLDLRSLPLDHPDGLVLVEELQAFYASRYGDGDTTPMRAGEFVPPAGYFVIGYVDGEPAACGGWRAREGDEPGLADGDAELKRMYVRAAHRGRGRARALLAHLEDAARAAGRRRLVLETGLRQPEAIALYRSAGYAPTTKFGVYRDEPDSRCFAKDLVVAAGVAGPGRPDVLGGPPARGIERT
jgi:GNAT superfamily N-acetyltransferase